MTRPGFCGELVHGGDWRMRDYRGQRVAVIATGAEAARIVPHVVRTATSVKVFQQSPDWVVPRRIPLPLVGGRVRRAAARLHLRLAVRDPWTRRQLTPTDGRHRVTVSRAYYAALQAPTCKLITWPVYAVVPNGVRSAEGIEHHVDVIVLGDGVDLADPAIREERIA